MQGAVALPAAAALVGTASAAPARPHVAGHSERLAARARRGDHLARTKLVEEHMGLVRSIAFRYRDLGLPMEDLVQEGAIGLLTAIDDYDSTRGASFSTFAFWRARAAVTHAITAHGQLLRLPRPVLERRRLVSQARERLTAAGREPRLTELADATGLPPVEVVAALAPADIASLDQPSVHGTPLGELTAADAAGSPEAQLVSGEELSVVRGAVHRLPGRKRTIVSRHFGLAGKPEALTEIADDLRLSPERTRALKDEALRELAVALEPAIGT
jgi:RNA polymerase sigma factor (sigma-70 family)